jgi:hypothetical protein
MLSDNLMSPLLVESPTEDLHKSSILRGDALKSCPDLRCVRQSVCGASPQSPRTHLLQHVAVRAISPIWLVGFPDGCISCVASNNRTKHRLRSVNRQVALEDGRFAISSIMGNRCPLHVHPFSANRSQRSDKIFCVRPTKKVLTVR